MLSYIENILTREYAPTKAIDTKITFKNNMPTATFLPCFVFENKMSDAAYRMAKSKTKSVVALIQQLTIQHNSNSINNENLTVVMHLIQ